MTVPVAFFLNIALVGGFSACGDSEQHFGDAAIIEVEFERYDGTPLALYGLAKPFPFARFDEQFAVALGLVVEPVGLGVDGNVAIDQPKFTVFQTGIGFSNIGFAFAQGFYL